VKRSALSDTGDITGVLRGRLEIARMRSSTPSVRKDGRQHEMPSGRDPDGKSEFDLDNEWYEAFADKVHQFGKKWPEALTDEEFEAAIAYADSKVRRPESEKWDE
jgi:hypothetical protein